MNTSTHEVTLGCICEIPFVFAQTRTLKFKRSKRRSEVDSFNIEKEREILGTIAASNGCCRR